MRDGRQVGKILEITDSGIASSECVIQNESKRIMGKRQRGSSGLPAERFKQKQQALT